MPCRKNSPSTTGNSSRSHEVPPEPLAAQAAALGVELRFHQAAWKTHEEKFIATLRAHAGGITHTVFVDIDLIAHREWKVQACLLLKALSCLNPKTAHNTLREARPTRLKIY